ncbi:MAG TPA: MinD/ParA family protein, partial [Acidimicrobiia bacterium]|nr:MinD/ParA family protein [Acidimicrobiia bacterium]
PERVARMVKALGEAFPFVVVDTGSGLDEFTLAAGEVATDFVLVAVTDVPSVRCMRKEVEALDQIGMTTQSRHFVLNRSDRQVGLSFIDIEETVGMPIDVAVPSSVVVTVSMNQGNPLLASEDISPSSDALFQLVTRFAEVPADVARRFSKRRGKVR